MNSTMPSPAEIAIYCAEAQNETMSCLGWCPNPGIGGVGARFAAFAQAIISGMSYPNVCLEHAGRALQRLKEAKPVS